ncbi:MAG: HIT family protein [Candidatus Flexifilum sp.]|jgi:ATP adenylyltransferase
MIVEHLWTPWRMAYIRGDRQSADRCVFCDAPQQDDAPALIVARSKWVYAILNLFPYNSGHLMIIPYRHLSSPEELNDDELLDQGQMINRALAVLRRAYQPHGFNLGANIGSVAGAGIAQHYHFHVVPRWGGDANFMTTIGETRVLPDTLENTQRVLSNLWKEMFP